VGEGKGEGEGEGEPGLYPVDALFNFIRAGGNGET